MALKADGTVWAWGINSFGCLGIGQAADVAVPQQAVGLSDVVSIKAGFYHAVAITGDGKLWSWGYNVYGQLGLGTSTNSNVPIHVANVTTGAVAAAAGQFHTLVVTANGGVLAFGRNTNGQLGNATTANSSLPVTVSGLSDVVDVAAGFNFSMALKADGTVWTWGSGVLGNGTPNQSNVPVMVPNLAGVVAIAAGGYHAVVLMADGTLRVWGIDNTYGQLGSTTLPAGFTPSNTVGLTGVSAIKCGTYNTTAIKSDGTVWGWGLNDKYQLGVDNAGAHPIPARMPFATSVVDAAGGINHTMLLRADGLLVGYGENRGSLGNGATLATLKIARTQEFGITNAVRVVARDNHQLILAGDGSVWAWGTDVSGVSPPIHTTDRLTQIPLSENVISVSTGTTHSLLLADDGGVWALGGNSYGQLGDGTTAGKSSPVKLTAFTNAVTATAAGDQHSLALDSTGAVWSWGYNYYGQLGSGASGSTASRSTPEVIAGLSNVTNISAGTSHSLAVSNGVVMAWGRNTYRQLGDGTNTTRTTPVQVQGGLSSVVAVSAGDIHSLALKSDGTVWAWGYNSSGQLGDGSTTYRSTPVQVQGGLSNVVAIYAGANHSLALKADGTLWAWGSRNNGQIGDGNNSGSALLPVQVPGIAGAVSCSGNSKDSLTVLADGTLRRWGIGSTIINRVPVVANIALTTSSSDSDQDGVDDDWEMTHFSTLSAILTQDHDYDGLNSLQEYIVGTDPNVEDDDHDRLTDLIDPYPHDFYNGDVPTVGILSGNNQSAPAGDFNSAPLDVAVWSSDGTMPYVNAPVSYTVVSGGGLLSAESGGLSPTEPSVVVQTDEDGVASVYFKQPEVAGIASVISATAATYTVTFNSLSTGPDVTPPSVPVGLSGNAITQTSFTLSWTASTDNLGVTGYEVFKDGQPLGSATTTEFEVTGLTTSTTYSFTVKATDAAGNRSAASSVLEVTTLPPPDVIAPTAPSGLAVNDLTQTSLTLSWTASTDNVGVAGYDVFKDGVFLGSATITELAVTGLTASTTYSFTVKAKDAAGNVSAASDAVEVTTLPASPDITAPTAPTDLVSSNLTSSGVTLTWTASTDNLSVTAYGIYQDGILITTVSTNSCDVTGLSAATGYAFNVNARDAAGNISAFSSTLNVTTSGSAGGDGNNLDDAWETLFFGTTGNGDSGNPDGDALTNLQEYQQGRMPTVADDDVAFYVSGDLGDDVAYDGTSVWPGLPGISSGPKQTLQGAVAVATTEDILLILPSATPYSGAGVSPTGKDLVLRPVGEVIYQP